MRLYCEGKDYKLYEGSMLDMLDEIPLNSIDAVLTDPPYEIGFMGKSWDKSGIAFQKETWEKRYKVLKPGGYLLSFGGCRTFHRIACAIEDAGFEIRDTIMWVYGCYSSDTQVLTDSGWKYFYDLDKTEKILQWDKNTNKLTWVKPLNYFEYDVDTNMKLFENRHISQLVTPNHKVAVSVKKRRKQFGEYELINASDIQKSWILNFPLAGEKDGNIHENDAYIIGWWLTDAWKHGDGKACMFSQSKPKTLNKLRNYFDTHNIKYSEYIKHCQYPHNDEHTFYVTGDIANKLLTEYPDRELNWKMLDWDKESRLALLEGLMDGDGSYRDGEYSRAFWSQKENRLDIVQALCLSLNYRAYINNDKSSVVFNTKHNSTETQTKHRKDDVPYSGKVYCLETETGAFVVRRNGKAFISGNSGFPKSQNLGKSIEAKLTMGTANTQAFTNLDGDKTDKGDWGYARFQYDQGARPSNYDENGNLRTTKVNYHTSLREKYDGWGTALKPAHEDILIAQKPLVADKELRPNLDRIIVARKPCEGSTTDNVIKYGVGGINIDECRIGVEERTYKGMSSNKPGGAGCYRDDNWQPKDIENTVNGRFPSNLILTYDETDKEEVCGGFPDGKSTQTIDAHRKTREEDWVWGSKSCGIKNDIDDSNRIEGYDDSGSASRYFYCAKASRRDRDDGLPDGIRNTHPTVKPTDLMAYLVRLVTPNGGTVLDPFNGSGSTGKAVMYENKDHNKNYKYIGIDLSNEYLEISKARIDYANNDTSEVFVETVNDDTNEVVKEKIVECDFGLWD